MGNALRRRHSAFAAGLATGAMALGFTAIPAHAAPPPRVDLVAVGDSYTAGTGAGPAERPPGLDCWQSHPGYVDVLRRGGEVKVAANAACHGAVLSKYSPTYDREIYTPTVQQQIQSLIRNGALSADTELVSITAGANDLGFASVLGICASSGEQACAGAVGLATSDNALHALTLALAATYTDIRKPAPSATVAALGYPLLFDATSPSVALPILISNQQLINQATLRVNAAIEAAAFLAGAEYVDVTDEFAGHEANSADPWLQLALKDFTADYNFHPNKAGHAAYAAALLASVNLKQLARP
jgi:lysophospholipase L1-like esterase